jgi:hypothetical protein
MGHSFGSSGGIEFVGHRQVTAAGPPGWTWLGWTWLGWTWLGSV